MKKLTSTTVSTVFRMRMARVCSASGHATGLRRTSPDAASADMRSHSSLASCDARFLATELVRGARRMCSFPALARDLAHAIAIHRGKAAAARPTLVRRGVGLRLGRLRAVWVVVVAVPHIDHYSCGSAHLRSPPAN